jgi:hypothetical protein
MNQAADLVAIFHDGFTNHRHAPNGRRASGEERQEFIDRHRDLYRLAQAIGTLYCKPIQQELDSKRREVMQVISGLVKPCHLGRGFGAGPAVVTPRKTNVKAMLWSDYLMTPEFHLDMSLTGIILSRKLVCELTDAHRRQVQAILRVAGF